jgi:hypothetical protein
VRASARSARRSTTIGDRVLTGARQLVIAGVVIAAIAALSVSGVRRTLD